MRSIWKWVGISLWQQLCWFLWSISLLVLHTLVPFLLQHWWWYNSRLYFQSLASQVCMSSNPLYFYYAQTLHKLQGLIEVCGVKRAFFMLISHLQWLSKLSHWTEVFLFDVHSLRWVDKTQPAVYKICRMWCIVSSWKLWIKLHVWFWRKWISKFTIQKIQLWSCAYKFKNLKNFVFSSNDKSF